MFVKRVVAGQAGPKKLSDGGGLYITTTTSGTPVWRVKYRFGGKEKLYAVAFGLDWLTRKMRFAFGPSRGGP